MCPNDSQECTDSDENNAHGPRTRPQRPRLDKRLTMSETRLNLTSSNSQFVRPKARLRIDRRGRHGVTAVPEMLLRHAGWKEILLFRKF